jgi:hypothetical protein
MVNMYMVSPHTDNQATSLLSIFSFQFDIDNKSIIGTMHVQFRRGVEITYILFVNHNSYVNSSAYCNRVIQRIYLASLL